MIGIFAIIWFVLMLNGCDDPCDKVRDCTQYQTSVIMQYNPVTKTMLPITIARCVEYGQPRLRNKSVCEDRRYQDSLDI